MKNVGRRGRVDSSTLQLGSIGKRIIRVSVFFAAWELLKSEVERSVRDYFLKGFDPSDLGRLEAYERQVISKHASIFEASFDWLAQAGALSEKDIMCIRQLGDYRREIAGSLPRFLIDSSRSLDLSRVAQLTRLLKRLSNHVTEGLASSRPWTCDGGAVASNAEKVSRTS